MHLAHAVGCEGSIVGIDLGGPEYVRIVLGAVEGVKESAGLLLCLFEQGLERGDVPDFYHRVAVRVGTELWPAGLLPETGGFAH
jgi:hypothetical protein